MFVSKMRRSKSTESVRNPNSQACKLISSNVSNAPFLNYLNLIDLESKENIYNSTVPWHHIPLSEDAILRYSSQLVFNYYKDAVLIEINNCDLTELSCFIRKVLKVTKMFGIPLVANTSYCLYYDILQSLFDHGLNDSKLLLTLWNTLCVSDKLKVAVFSGLIEERQNSAEILEIILRSALNERFNFWGAWTENHELKHFPYCPVTAALLGGNEEQMNVLLKYGFEPNSKRIATYDKHFMYYGNKVYDWLRKPLLESISSRKKIITDVLIFLASIAISQSHSKRISMLSCFHLLWDVIPTPYVTLKELRNEIQSLFSSVHYCSDVSYFPSTQSMFSRLCEFYEIVMLMYEEEPLQPRSLKHLCKCKIRRELQKSWNLPMGIDNLPLPNHLKEYLHVSL